MVLKYIYLKTGAFRASMKPARIDAWSFKYITKSTQARDNIDLDQDDRMDLDMDESKHIPGTSCKKKSMELSRRVSEENILKRTSNTEQELQLYALE